MISIVINSLINTIFIILLIPIFGFIVDKLVQCIIKDLSEIIGYTLTNIIVNRLTFVGTMIHEISHALMATITGAKVTKIELFKPVGNRLGQVSFIPRGNAIMKSIQFTLTSIAPVVIGSTLLFIIFMYSGNVENKYIKAINIYLFISILMHTTMSTQDVKNALRGLPICTFLIFSINFILYMFKII